MKNKLLIFFILTLKLMSQNSVTSSGGKIYGPNAEIDYNIGQLITNYFHNNSTIVTSGTLQPNYLHLTNLNRSNSVDYLQIYPNPTKDLINVKSNKHLSTEIWDLSGKLLKTEQFGNCMELSSLINGAYILKIYNENYELINTTKIIKN